MTEEERTTLVGLGGKIIEGLRGGGPLLLALVVLNIFSVGGILWSVREERILRADVSKTEQDLIGDMARLLSGCMETKR